MTNLREELEKINFNEIVRRIEESWNDYNNGHKLSKEDFTSIVKQFRRIQQIIKESKE